MPARACEDAESIPAIPAIPANRGSRAEGPEKGRARAQVLTLIAISPDPAPLLIERFRPIAQVNGPASEITADPDDAEARVEAPEIAVVEPVEYRIAEA